MKIISNKAEVDCNPLDHYYNQLNCDISYLDPKTADYKTIENYIQSTHAKTHSMYTMKVLDVFECAKQMETDRFQVRLAELLSLLAESIYTESTLILVLVSPFLVLLK